MVDCKARSQNFEKRLLSLSFLSVCPSALNNSAVTGRIFPLNLIFDKIFENLPRKFKVSLKSDTNNGYSTRGPVYIFDNVSLNSFLE